MARDWSHTNLGQVADWSSGTTPSKARRDYWSGDIPWVSPKDMKRFELHDTQDHISQRAVDAGAKLVPPNTVFVVVRGMILAHTFPVCIAQRTMSFNQDVKALVPYDGTNGRFLAHWLQGSADKLLRIVTEATHGTKRIELRDLQSTSLELPQIEEQKRIAEILDTLDEAIRKTEQIVAKLKQVNQGLLHDLLTRGIDDNGELRDPLRHPKHFKDSALGRIPLRWNVCRVDKLLLDVNPAMRSGPFGSALLKSELVEHGVPLLGIDNVHVERFVPEYSRFVSPRKAAELSRYRVRANDVMITIMGTVGRCCVVPESIGDALSSKHVWTISFDEAIYSPTLACLQFNYAPWVLRHFSRDEQGGIMSAIRAETLRSTLLPVPPRAEATVIEHVLLAASQRIDHEAAEAAKLKLVRQGLADDLLTGSVRVSADRSLSRRSEPRQSQLGLGL